MEKLQQQMDYWKGHLKGMPQVLELPTDHMRPMRQSFRGGIEQRIISNDLLERVNAVGKGERASLFMTLLAVCQVLLMRYSGQEDFGVGTVVANRKRAEMEPIIRFLPEYSGDASEFGWRAYLPRSAAGRRRRRWAGMLTRTCHLKNWWKSWRPTVMSAVLLYFKCCLLHSVSPTNWNSAIWS